MEQPGQYAGLHHSRQPLFQSPQLPPPSQLFNRPNTLPPIPNIPSNSPQGLRFPPVSPYSSHGIQNSSLPSLPSPSTSQPSWSTVHRTSNSRDEIHPSQHHGGRHDHQRDPLVKRESASSQLHHHHEQHQHHQQQAQNMKDNAVASGGVAEDGMPSTSDFVKKLYKMLEDQSFQHVVSWGPQGDCFVVKDMNEFTKSILPRMFKHSNFASFVRQLNKYDFHKVKNTDDNQFGEHSWTFRHPDFHADRRDALENIKRKVPTQRKPAQTASTRPISSTSPAPYASSSAAVEALQSQVDRLTQAQEEMSVHVRNLERNYQDVLVEMVNFQRNMAQQDGLMQNLIQYFLQVENGKVKDNNISNNDPNGPSSSDQNPFLPTQAAQRMMGSYPESDVARASLAQMNEISRRAEVAGMSFSEPSNISNANSNAGGSRQDTSRVVAAAAADLMSGREKLMTRQDALARIEELQRSRPASAQGSGYVDGNEPFVMDSGTGEGTNSTLQTWNNTAGTTTGASHQGLQVYTLGHLMPKNNADDGNGNWSFDASSLGLPVLGGVGSNGLMGQGQSNEGDANAGYGVPESNNGGPDPTFVDDSSAASGSGAGPSVMPSRPSSSQKLRVRRSTFVPGWAVPPRVLLVDDDAVSRKLSSKFLQVFGCTIDVAVDGVGAVNKMNLEKYDLVLMDIVMPKLDGVSATSLIRQFDHMTPIISMTSNSKPNEIMTYYSSGMNDILPKPFTKEGLLDMLEKHLMHLKVIQQMSKVPRSVGIPPLSDSSFEQALTTQAASINNGSGVLVPMIPGAGDDDGRINPLAGMGLSDEQYAMILQNLVNGESFPGVAGGEKRALDDTSDGRDSKRSRFEVVE